jgi:ABC-type Fe3+/spermidine/putrescine transport system ATPase subunit
MTTADLIAVMNGGKIDQLGSPEDIYDRPESEFVARFIGAANVIEDTARDANHVAFANTTLEVVGIPLTTGQSAAVAIRQHDIGLVTHALQDSRNTHHPRAHHRLCHDAPGDCRLARARLPHNRPRSRARHRARCRPLFELHRPPFVLYGTLWS